MGYTHAGGVVLGLAVLLGLLHHGVSIRCYSCDVTSPNSYADANEKCNSEGSRDCLSNEDSACMLEGFLRESNTVRVTKKCMRGCPLYINTTAEVVRCCTEDSCNAKFEPIPARRPPQSQQPRGYNPNRERGYNGHSQGTNRPYPNNNIDIKRLDQRGANSGPMGRGSQNGPMGRGSQNREDANEANGNKILTKATPLPGDDSVTMGNEVQVKDTKMTHREKGMMKKMNEKKYGERNSLAEQKSKKNDSAKMGGNSAWTVLPTGELIVLSIMHVVISFYAL